MLRERKCFLIRIDPSGVEFFNEGRPQASKKLFRRQFTLTERLGEAGYHIFLEILNILNVNFLKKVDCLIIRSDGKTVTIPFRYLND